MKQKFLHQLTGIKDLSETLDGPLHAIALTIQRASQAIQRRWPRISISEIRGPRIMNAQEEFDDLLIPHDYPQRSPNKVLYLAEDQLLRSHMTPMVTRAFMILREKNLEHAAFIMPGICYLRALPAPGRVSEPHKLDVLLCQPRYASGRPELAIVENLMVILHGMFQGKTWRHRFSQKVHPYTEFGLSVELCIENGPWIKVLECGSLSAPILKKNNIDPQHLIATVFGFGLERCVMVLKEIDDIRLLTYPSQKIQKRMFNLIPTSECVKYPSVCTELRLPPLSKELLEEIFVHLRWEHPSLFSLIYNINAFQKNDSLKLDIEWKSPIRNISTAAAKEWTEQVASLADEAWIEKWKI